MTIPSLFCKLYKLLRDRQSKNEKKIDRYSYIQREGEREREKERERERKREKEREERMEKNKKRKISNNKKKK